MHQTLILTTCRAHFHATHLGNDILEYVTQVVFPASQLFTALTMGLFWRLPANTHMSFINERIYIQIYGFFSFFARGKSRSG